MDEFRQLTRMLWAGNTDIESLNGARCRLSALKCGKLSKATQPAQIINVVISGVPGGDLSTVGSGLTTPPASAPWAAGARMAADNLSADAEAVGRRLAGDARDGDDGHVMDGQATVATNGARPDFINQKLIQNRVLGLNDSQSTASEVGGNGEHSPAAGSLADRSAATELAPDAAVALTDNNAYPWLARAGATLVVGPTETNVADRVIRVW